MELACTNACTISGDTWIAVAAAWTATTATSTTAEDTCNIASDAWKAWADALNASNDIRNIALDASNALKLEPSSSLVDAKLLEALKAVYESLAHHSFGAHGPHA
jgi:hypothetical protein